METVIKAISHTREWRLAQQNSEKDNDLNKATTITRPIPPEVVLCNTDGAWNEGKMTAGLGWVFYKRNSCEQSSEVIEKGALVETFVNSPLMAEALAFRNALFRAKNRGTSKLCMFSDSRLLIRAVNGTSSIKEIYGVLQDILSLVSEFSFFEVRFVPRDNNDVTDSLAKSALQNLPPVTY